MDLAEIGAIPNGGCCRLTLTDEDKRARDLFANGACGRLPVDVDRGRQHVRDTAGPAKRRRRSATGSHLDTQPHGGRFDGIYGVLAGLEVIRTLNDAEIETELPVAVVNWTNEEGVRFPAGILGSTAYAGRWRLTTCTSLVATDRCRRSATN